jgi:hypothetical protein
MKRETNKGRGGGVRREGLISDSGSGAFLTPGSEIRDKFCPDPGSRILDPTLKVLRALQKFLSEKYLNSFSIDSNLFLYVYMKFCENKFSCKNTSCLGGFVLFFPNVFRRDNGWYSSLCLNLERKSKAISDPGRHIVLLKTFELRKNTNFVLPVKIVFKSCK